MSDNATSTASDLDLDASWQSHIVACAAATWVTAAVFVGLRFFLRGHLLHVLGREDWVILVALVFSAGHSASFIVAAHFGMGKHSAALTVTALERVTETYWFALLWFSITVYLTKISIMLLYLRTLTHAWVQRTLKVLMVIVVLTSITDLGLIFTSCIPLQAYWDPSIRAAYCHSMRAYYAILGIQLGTDFFTFLLPLPVIWSMRAPRDQKMLLLMLFSFGFFICIISIIRLTELTSVRSDTDFTWDSVSLDFWSMIEANTAIACACVMTMKPLLRRLAPGSATKRGETTQDPMGFGGAFGGGGKNNTYNPPTIGSKPSRPNAVVKKQSWFTAQLARLDRSLQTLNETEAGSESYAIPSIVEAGLQLPRLPTSVFLMPMPDMPRRSRHSSSSLSMRFEHEIDEGPLEQQRWSRRPSYAPSSPRTMRRPSAAPSSPPITMRRPSCAPSSPATTRRPSVAPSSPG